MNYSVKKNTNRTLYDPLEFKEFFIQNRLPQCADRQEQPRLPLSYYVPTDYFPNVPADQRIPESHKNKQPTVIPSCNDKTVDATALDNYEFQTEQFLATLGLNIYDGSCWSIALSLLGETELIQEYESEIIKSGGTCQFGDLHADEECKGVQLKGECLDPFSSGACGFCYGSGTNAERTMAQQNAWLFRMITDYWALDGTKDERCPELSIPWTWNDYKPILGENSWSRIIGPLQVAYITYGSVEAIPADDLSITMATDLLKSLQRMIVPNVGAIYYAPNNVIVSATKDAGFDVSTENNISLLGGLKMLRYIFTVKSIHSDKMQLVNDLIDSITDYIKNSYDPQLGYFRQGGSVDPVTNTFSWATGSSLFAVDCQTWAMSVVSPLLIDQWFGAKTSHSIWQTTKKLGGYNYNLVTDRVDGVGFTVNDVDQVFSGEWTFGAINMLRIFANEYADTSFEDEANYLRQKIQEQLTETVEINKTNCLTVKYSNKRYFIPFGWWANPLPSVASTGWAVMVDSEFNPFHLGGAYKVNY